MPSTSPVALILGAGPNIGASVAKKFATKGYKVVLTARKFPENPDPSYSYIKGDFSQPRSVVDTFAEVRKLYGEPSVVVYNGR